MSKSSSGVELEWENSLIISYVLSSLHIGVTFQAIYKPASPSSANCTEGKVHRLVIHH